MENLVELKDYVKLLIQKPMVYSIRQNYQDYLSCCTDSQAKQYIENRLICQMDWYNRKSLDFQQRYQRLSIAAIVLSALIPVMAIGAENIVVRVLLALMGSAIAAISAVLALCKYRELSTDYRTSCEILQSYLHRYFTKTCEFTGRSDEEAFNLLVSICEDYLMQEFKYRGPSSVLQKEQKEQPVPEPVGVVNEVKTEPEEA